MGEVLKFYARGSALVSAPGVPRITGSRPHYVGRDFVAATEDSPAMHPANATGITVDIGSRQGRKHANQLVRHMRHGSLWGDKAACRYAGLRYEDFRLMGGVNVPAEDASQKNEDFRSLGAEKESQAPKPKRGANKE